MADNSLFPRKSDIFRGSTLDIRDSLGRVSLDALYQVTFSFGKSRTWLKGDEPGKNRTQGTDFKRKMSLLCTQAEIPGTSFTTDLAVGHHQGIQESFPNLRNFPPLNLTFYCDADMVILEVLERWMSFINPVKNKRDYAAFSRFEYPEDYKEILHVTKFERDTFSEKKGSYQSGMAQYEFVNVWPTDLTSMRVAYGEPNVLQCSVQFVYDRFFTSFDNIESEKAVPIQTPNGIVNSNDIQNFVDFEESIPEVIPQYQINRNNLNASRNRPNSTPYVNPATNYRNRKRGSGAR